MWSDKAAVSLICYLKIEIVLIKIKIKRSAQKKLKRLYKNILEKKSWPLLHMEPSIDRILRDEKTVTATHGAGILKEAVGIVKAMKEEFADKTAALYLQKNRKTRQSFVVKISTLTHQKSVKTRTRALFFSQADHKPLYPGQYSLEN